MLKMAKRGRKRKRTESWDSPPEVCFDTPPRDEKYKNEQNGLKLFDSETSSSESDEEECLNYDDIIDFFIPKQRFQASTVCGVPSLAGICSDFISNSEHLSLLLKGIPATVLENLRILEKIGPEQLYSVDKNLKKKERVSVTDRYWKVFCEQHFKYGKSVNGKTYKDIYIKSCKFFRREAKKVDRGIKRRDDKIQKQMDDKIAPIWEQPLIGSLEMEEKIDNDDFNDDEDEDIDYPE